MKKDKDVAVGKTKIVRKAIPRSAEDIAKDAYMDNELKKAWKKKDWQRASNLVFSGHANRKRDAEEIRERVHTNIPVVDDSFGEPQTELDIAKEIIGYLLSKLPDETGKGIDRAKNFIS